MNPLAASDNLPHLFASQLTKPTVVFIPGAFHTAAHFGPLSRYLETQGCESFSVRLPSMGDPASNRNAGMAEDVAAIRGVLEELVRDEENGDGQKEGGYMQRDDGRKEVVLVMHSSGAVAGCQAVASFERSLRIKRGKNGGVISLVFIGGLLVDEGGSLESTMEELGEGALPSHAAVEGPILRPSNAATAFFADLPSETAAYWAFQLEPQSTSVYTAPVKNTCWDLDIPIVYVICSQDSQLQVKNTMLARVKRVDWIIKTVEAGQAPFLNCVEEAGDLILRAGRMGQGGRF